MRTSLGLAALVLALTGCSFSIGGADAVTQAELEKQLAASYTGDTDQEITAECEGDLEAEVDATQVCVVKAGEGSADVRVVVTKVNDEDVDFEASTFVSPERLGTTVKDTLAGQGIDVDSVDCEGELDGEVDATTTCTVTPDQGLGELEITVTSVEGLMVNFDIEQVS